MRRNKRSTSPANYFRTTFSVKLNTWTTIICAGSLSLAVCSRRERSAKHQLIGLEVRSFAGLCYLWRRAAVRCAVKSSSPPNVSSVIWPSTQLLVVPSLRHRHHHYRHSVGQQTSMDSYYKVKKCPGLPQLPLNRQVVQSHNRPNERLNSRIWQFFKINLLVYFLHSSCPHKTF